MKTVIGRLFHVSYTVEGTWRLLRRYGWSWQQPTRRAIERDDDAVELWKREVWPRVSLTHLFGKAECPRYGSVFGIADECAAANAPAPWDFARGHAKDTL
ncbi:winged helix-turn-helix domain-containing protein [Streptomyces sp. NPDC091416]|uniref:helix-turn-helix domain-containing protein n=1 Tax=Streptomyces sp. NPDC091416 TaxID=3366003 RepID=UPI0038135184